MSIWSADRETKTYDMKHMGVIKAGQHMIHFGGDKDRLSDCLKAGFSNLYSSKILKIKPSKMERFMQELMVVTIDTRESQTQSTITLPTVSYPFDVLFWCSIKYKPIFSSPNSSQKKQIL